SRGSPARSTGRSASPTARREPATATRSPCGSTGPVPSGTDVPVVVFVHGGGFVQNNVVMYDPLCTFLAARVRAVAVSVDYRLAPEHRAPVPAHDVIDAVTAVAGLGAVLRADTTRLALVGDSAGGTLATVAAQALRDRGSSPVRHQALLYPATDLTLA